MSPERIPTEIPQMTESDGVAVSMRSRTVDDPARPSHADAQRNAHSRSPARDGTGLRWTSPDPSGTATIRVVPGAGSYPAAQWVRLPPSRRLR